MPIYVYRCKKCDAVEEHIQRFSDPPMEKCEACGGRLEKQITGAAFHLKGGGWYADGYASSKPDSGSQGDGGSGGDTGGSSGDASGGSSDAGGSSKDKPKAKPKDKPKSKGSSSAKGSD